jgi:hypothetical protein
MTSARDCVEDGLNTFGIREDVDVTGFVAMGKDLEVYGFILFVDPLFRNWEGGEEREKRKERRKKHVKRKERNIEKKK